MDLTHRLVCAMKYPSVRYMLAKEFPMSELLPVLEAMIQEAEAGRACVLCAVVARHGSTPQVPGATLLRARRSLDRRHARRRLCRSRGDPPRHKSRWARRAQPASPT